MLDKKYNRLYQYEIKDKIFVDIKKKDLMKHKSLYNPEGLSPPKTKKMHSVSSIDQLKNDLDFE